VQKIYPVDEIIEIMKCFPVRRQRRLSVAYIMIEGVNDTDEHLSALKSMLAGSRIRVNLLPFNQTGRDLRKSSGMERIELFRHDLVINGISASIRKSRGADISAACGLLASGLRDRGDNNILSDSRY
jgi:23S rRNA (adenine2503-C2)-methyltransferase